MAKNKSKKKSPKKSPSSKHVHSLPVTDPLSLGSSSDPASSVPPLVEKDAKVDLSLIDQAISVVVVSDLGRDSEIPNSDLISKSTKVAKVTDLVSKAVIKEAVAAVSAPLTTAPPPTKAASVANPVSKPVTMVSPDDSWTDLVKGQAKKLQKKGESFILPSGEACVKIPNEIIERNKTSWEYFVLGQFYSDAPSIGTLHSIANGFGVSSIETLLSLRWKAMLSYSGSPTPIHEIG